MDELWKRVMPAQLEHEMMTNSPEKLVRKEIENGRSGTASFEKYDIL